MIFKYTHCDELFSEGMRYIALKKNQTLGLANPFHIVDETIEFLLSILNGQCGYRFQSL